MNPLKKLASQTVVYGLSSIVGRFLNYLLVPFYTRYFTTGEYGVVSEFYAYSGFFGVLLTLGFETGYFRFVKSENEERLYSTSLTFLSIVSVFFVGIIWLFTPFLSGKMHYANHPEYFTWFALILAFDAICAIPFAKLRNENKAFSFAGIKLFEILVNVGLNLFFIIICKGAYEKDTSSALGSLYKPEIGVGYVFISNLLASVAKLMLLSFSFKGLKAGFDSILFKKILTYSLPMVVIGFAGIINEMLDRVILKYLLPFDAETNLQQLGIYAACYKLSIVMSLFIQAFRFAAEPFFFAHADKSDSRKIYADVMNWFVIFCCFIFMVVTLFIDYFGLFIGKDFRVGLGVVPILLLANLFLGIYVNLSIWYKLTDRTMTGAYVSLGGALLTIVLNVLLIPKLGYMGSAYATLVCYASMAGVSYLLGQKFYPVPYDRKKVGGYLLLLLVLHLFHSHAMDLNKAFFNLPVIFISVIFLLIFLAVVWLLDGRKLRQMIK